MSLYVVAYEWPTYTAPERESGCLRIAMQIQPGVSHRKPDMVPDELLRPLVYLKNAQEAVAAERCRHLNLLLDLRRVIDGEPTINGFEEVEAIKARLAELKGG
jgi:hypothetical protein